MGNLLSGDLSKSNEKLLEQLDTIAVNLIIKQDFKSMKKLFNKEYCERLKVLSSRILSKKFSNIEIEKLNKRIKLEENVIDKDYGEKKQNFCNNLAKFYVKIAHLYSAILSTINPEYTYKDNKNIERTGGLLEKVKREKTKEQVGESDFDDDDDFVDSEELILPKEMGLCSKRIQTLLNEHVEQSDLNKAVKLNPAFCNRYTDSSTVIEETGIPELFNLYKDIYNPETGRFYEMSDSAKKEYNNDVKKYYFFVTGKRTIPKEMGELNFSKIKLKDYGLTEKCRGDNAPFKKEYTGTLKEKLFAEYVENVKQMIIKTNKDKDLLIKILQKVFLETKNKETGEVKVTIQPTLTMKKLEKLISETRRIIIKMYLECEKDFEKGLKIFEAIIEKIKYDTSVRRIDLLDSDLDLLSSDYVKSNELEIKEYNEETLLAQKDCLRYPGWRKSFSKGGKPMWSNPIEPGNWYSNLYSDQKGQQNTAIRKDASLCREPENIEKCRQQEEKWPELFKNEPHLLKKCNSQKVKVDGILSGMEKRKALRQEELKENLEEWLKQYVPEDESDKIDGIVSKALQDNEGESFDTIKELLREEYQIASAEDSLDNDLEDEDDNENTTVDETIVEPRRSSREKKQTRRFVAGVDRQPSYTSHDGDVIEGDVDSSVQEYQDEPEDDIVDEPENDILSDNTSDTGYLELSSSVIEK